MSNRVEELEQTVSELESTIEGLTEELVDAKERIRVLEGQLDVDAGDYVREQSDRTPRERRVAREAEPDEIEAAVEGETGAEADKAADPEESEEDADDGSGSELGDDIIVA